MRIMVRYIQSSLSLVSSIALPPFLAQQLGSDAKEVFL